MLTVEEYESLVLLAFEVLMRDFSLRHESTRSILPDYYVKLKGHAVRLDVGYEIDSNLWVAIEALDPANGEKRDRSSLESLLEARLEGGYHRTKPPKDRDAVLEILRQKAEQLRQYGTDVLRGNFEVFARLHDIEQKELAAWKRWIRDPDSSLLPPRNHEH